MDILREVQRLVAVDNKDKTYNAAIKAMGTHQYIYKYTYDECEIGGVGYLLAKNEEDAISKMPYKNGNGFDCSLYYVMSTEDLKYILNGGLAEVTSEDMDSGSGYDTFRDRLKKEN